MAKAGMLIITDNAMITKLLVQYEYEYEYRTSIISKEQTTTKKKKKRRKNSFVTTNAKN